MDTSSRPLRIALVAGSFPVTSETFIVRRVVGLLERGLDVHVICDESRASEWMSFPDLPDVMDVGARVHVRPRTRPPAFALARFPVSLVRCFRRSPFRTARYLARGWRASGLRVLGRLIRDEELVVIGPDVVHFAFGVTARGSESIGRQLGCAVVVSFQGADLNYAGLEEDPGFYREVWRAADALHFLSEDLRRRAATRGYIDDDRARVILPGVDAASFVPPMRDRPHEGRLRVLSVGRLHWKKGYEYAMGALRELRDRGIDCCYRIVGSGEHREALLFARRDLGLDESVELAGAMPEAAVRDAMGWADVFLHPSTSEGFAYAVVEAQAMALPVVATDADGLSENVEHGSTGFVVGRRDAHALAEKIATLACDADLRRRMGEAGRERALRMFDLDREIGEFEDLYHRVAADRAR